MKVGITVICSVCGRMKRPRGRSAPIGVYYCEPPPPIAGLRYGRPDTFEVLPRGCDGYDQDPQVGDLWPGEREKDFGYPVRDAGVKHVDEAEAKI